MEKCSIKSLGRNKGRVWRSDGLRTSAFFGRSNFRFFFFKSGKSIWGKIESTWFTTTNDKGKKNSHHQLRALLLAVVICSMLNLHHMHVFLRLTPYESFPALEIRGMLYWRTRLTPDVYFPRVTSEVCFPALDTWRMFSRARHLMNVFPRLTPDARFPALDTRCMFSHAWHKLKVFQHLAANACCIKFDTSFLLTNLLTCSAKPFTATCTRSSNSCLVFFFCFLMVSTIPELGPRFHSNSLSTYTQTQLWSETKSTMNVTVKG